MRTVPGALVILLCASLAARADEPPRLSASVDRDAIEIGDRFTLTVEVARRPEVELLTSLQSLGMRLQHFQVKDIRQPDRRQDDDGLSIDTVEYELSTYRSGDYPIPPLTVAYRLPDGATGTISTDTLTIRVKSVLPEDDTGLALRDVKPPLVAPGSGAVERLVAWIAGGIVLLALLVALGIWGYRKWRNRAEAVPPVDPVDRAVRALQALRQSAAYGNGEARQFVFELSEILRRYLGGRWHYNAIDLTTEELAASLAPRGIPSAWHEPLLQMLRDCDRVKFADLPMERETMARHLNTAEAFVRETKPSTQHPAAEPQREVVHG